MVIMNFCKNCSIANIFFYIDNHDISTNIFQRRIIPIYSILNTAAGKSDGLTGMIPIPRYLTNITIAKANNPIPTQIALETWVALSSVIDGRSCLTTPCRNTADRDERVVLIVLQRKHIITEIFSTLLRPVLKWVSTLCYRYTVCLPQRSAEDGWEDETGHSRHVSK